MPTTGRRFPHVPAGGGTAYSLISKLIVIKVRSVETGDTFSMTGLLD
jgi:hypothetical protein